MGEIVETFPIPVGTGIETLPDPGIAAVFSGLGISSVQRGSISLGQSDPADLTGSFSLSPSVDLTKSLLVFRGPEPNFTDNPEGFNYPTVVFFNASIPVGGASVLFTRGSADGAVDAHASVMEFSGGVKTQPVSIVIDEAETSDIVTIDTVDMGRTIIIPNGVSAVGNGIHVETDPNVEDSNGNEIHVWWVLTNSTTVTASRHAIGVTGTEVTANATILEFL